MPTAKPAKTKSRPPHPWDVEADREEARAKRKVGKPRGRNGGRPVTTGTGTRVTFRASAAELATIELRAAAAGLTVPQYAKLVAVSGGAVRPAPSATGGYVQHIDGDPWNNHPANLRVVTASENR